MCVLFNPVRHYAGPGFFMHPSNRDPSPERRRLDDGSIGLGLFVEWQAALLCAGTISLPSCWFMV
jgi:hypothetical protein